MFWFTTCLCGFGPEAVSWRPQVIFEMRREAAQGRIWTGPSQARLFLAGPCWVRKSSALGDRKRERGGKRNRGSSSGV